MRSTFKVIFYLKKRSLKESEKNSQVRFPIMGRITVNGGQAAVTTKLSVSPEQWDTKANRARGKSEEAKEINRVLNNIHAKLIDTYHDLYVREKIVTAAKVKSTFEGIFKDQRTLMEAYEDYVKEFENRVGKDRKFQTLKNIRKSRQVLQNYMRDKLEIDDITFPELTPEFMKGLISYMRDDKHYSTSYMRAAVRKCRLLVHRARKKGIIANDPFKGYVIIRKYKEREMLDEADIRKLTEVELPNYKSRACRDMYLFMIFTGLSHCDLKKLTYDSLTVTPQGDMWIIDKRQKNEASFQVKLVPMAKELVERYRTFPGKAPDKVFPVKEYVTMFLSLKRIALKAGITKRITPHMGRHTFATTVTLEHGVPIETVSKMLGHRKITTTQIYAKVLKNKIDHDMDAVTARLESTFHLPEPNRIKQWTGKNA